MSGSDIEKSNAVEASTSIAIDDSTSKNTGSPIVFGCGISISPERNEVPLFPFVGPSRSTDNNKTSQSTSSFSQFFSPNVGPKPNNSFSFGLTVPNPPPSPFTQNFDPKPNNSFTFGPTFGTPNPEFKPNNLDVGPTFPKQPSQSGVDPTPSFGCGFSFGPSLWSNSTKAATPYAPTSTTFQFSPNSLKCFSNIPSPPIQKFWPPQVSEASTPTCHVCQRCGHKSLWGQIWGSQGKSYAPTSESQGIWGQACYQSISAMPFYQNKSHEELRWEDYQSKGNDYNKALSPFSSNPFIVGQTRATQFPPINGPALVIPLQGMSYFNHFI